MIILSIILLILVGILLIVLELLVLPGITVAGIAGTLMICAGIYLSFIHLGSTAGILTLVGSSTISIGTIVYSLRSKTWNKLMLKKKIEGKVETGISNPENVTVKAGDTGITVSRLAPMGKVMIKHKFFEAKVNNQFIDQDTEIEVINIQHNIIIVKTKKQ